MSRTDELVYSKAFFKFNDNFRFEFPREFDHLICTAFFFIQPNALE